MHIWQILRLTPFKAILPGNSAFEGPKNLQMAFKVALLNTLTLQAQNFILLKLSLVQHVSSQHTASFLFLFFCLESNVTDDSVTLQL